MKSKQNDPHEATIDTLAAPMTPSLKRFIIKPPVMMPKATAGRFSMPEWIKEERERGWEIYTHKILLN